MMTISAAATPPEGPRSNGANGARPSQTGLPGGPRSIAMPPDPAVELEMRKRRILRRASMTAGAAPASQQVLVDTGVVHRISKGRALLSQGDPATSIAFVGMGRLRVTRSLGGTRSLSLGYRGAGDVVGESALAGIAAYRDTAIATEDVEALLVPVATARALIAADQAFGSGFVTMLVERQTETEDRVASLLYRNVEQRLAELLIRSVARWGIPEPRGVLIAAPFTHQEMASMIGSTRETVTLTLGDLRKKGIIDVDRRRIVVLDREALKSRV